MKSKEQCSEATETREEVRRRQQGWMAQRAAQMERESLRSDLLKDDPLPAAGFDSRGSTSVESTRPAQSRISDDRVLDQITGLCNLAIFFALLLSFMNSLNGDM